MNYNFTLTAVSSIIESTFLIIALAVGTGETVLALDCETQQRISGEISGCNSISTQDLAEINRERYQACIEELLNMEIATYKNNRGDYYATWQWQQEQTETDVTSQQPATELQLSWISICFNS